MDQFTRSSQSLKRASKHGNRLQFAKVRRHPDYLSWPPG
ncbi:hypothetical protein I546_3244 [Mycobacterium kansasii 732]|nr:hypothetical protein I546_3244 [Mycobacterium kansasii 732]